MDKDSAPLETLRREIDRIDDTLHDLLMRRAEVVERIAAAKPADRVALRPGREAQILRRLLAGHRGSFPKAAMVRIWREMMGALVGLQGPFAVAAFAPERCSATLDIARAHFGSVCTVSPLHSPGQVVRAVAEGQVAVGVVPLPSASDEAEPWWVSLTAGGAEVPRVVARLPFFGSDETGQALVLAVRDHDDSGDDHTLVALETAPDVSRDRLRAAMAAAGLDFSAVLALHRRGPAWLYLIDLNGHMAPGDPRLAALIAARDPVEHGVMIGGYAVPLPAA